MSDDFTNELFRPEVGEERRRRIHGEVVLAQPTGTQLLVTLLFSVIAAVAIWLVLGEYSRTESARGILVTGEPSAKIVALRPGQITHLSVKEGDLVQAGQRLALVRTEPGNEAGGSAILESLDAVQAQRALAHRQVELSEARAISERERLASTVEGLKHQRASLSGQIALQLQLVTSAGEIVSRIETVVEKGFVSRLEVERRRQAWLTARQELSRLEQQLSAVNTQERSARSELTRIAAVTGSEAATALSAAQALRQEHARLQTERAYTIEAPISGRVTALQTAVGRTVSPALPLMVIVPEGSSLYAEVYAPTRAVGFVKPGQEVRLLYDAFPYRRFGSFKGHITAISRSVIDPRELAAPLETDEPVYRIAVTPDRQQLSAFGEAMPLQPGMMLTANIILDRRSFIDWLLQPLNAVIQRNGEN